MRYLGALLWLALLLASTIAGTAKIAYAKGYSAGQVNARDMIMCVLGRASGLKYDASVVRYCESIDIDMKKKAILK